MAEDIKYKKWIGSIVLILGVLLILLNIVSAQEKEIFIEIKIEPRGVITTNYNVVGDIFSYNISLYNNNSENLEDTISIEIYGPNNRNLSNNIFSYPSVLNLTYGKILYPTSTYQRIIIHIFGLLILQEIIK